MFFKFYIFLVAAVFISSCQNLQTRQQVQVPTVPQAASNVVEPVEAATQFNNPLNQQVIPVSPIPIPEIPKIGLILGPGGARAFAHIGFLQELQKEKIPIHSVGGLEFGAPMAALFAWKGYANDVEWQMMKLKVVNSGKTDFESKKLTEFLYLVFQKSKVEELKMPFACLAHNLNKNQIYVMSRGPVQDLIPYCWPYPTVMKSFNSNVSGLREPKLLADYLRSQGANYIVYVNVLAGQKKAYAGEKDSAENIMWQEISTQLSKNPPGIDYVLQLNVENYGILDFDKRRDILQKGSESGAQAVKALARKLNL